MIVNTINVDMPSQDVFVDRFRRKHWKPHADSIRDSTIGEVQNVRRLQFNSVIVPLDGARCAEHALPLAFEVAAASNVPIVLESADPSFEEASSPRRRGDVQMYLKDLADRIATNSVPVTSRLPEFPNPARPLSEPAGESSLVVMAERPRRVADLFRLSQRVEKLLKFGSSPLLFIRGYGWPYTLRKAKRIKHILVVLDGTAQAEQVLPAAMAIAEAVEAQLTLLRVIPGMPYYEISGAQNENEIEAKAYLESVVQSVQPSRVSVEPAVWTSDESLGQVILSYAQNCNADLIALTTSQRRTILGSFRRQPARYLARKSRIPLLIVSSDNSALHGDQPAKPQAAA